MATIQAKARKARVRVTQAACNYASVHCYPKVVATDCRAAWDEFDRALRAYTRALRQAAKA